MYYLAYMCSTLDRLRRFGLGLSHCTNQISVTLVCMNCYSTHSSAPMLEYRPTVFLRSWFTSNSTILRKYTQTNVVDVNIEGGNCRTALDQLSKRCKQLS